MAEDRLIHLGWSMLGTDPAGWPGFSFLPRVGGKKIQKNFPFC